VLQAERDTVTVHALTGGVVGMIAGLLVGRSMFPNSAAAAQTSVGAVVGLAGGIAWGLWRVREARSADPPMPAAVRSALAVAGWVVVTAVAATTALILWAVFVGEGCVVGWCPFAAPGPRDALPGWRPDEPTVLWFWPVALGAAACSLARRVSRSGLRGGRRAVAWLGVGCVALLAVGALLLGR
jgi:hypothetical protein